MTDEDGFDCFDMFIVACNCPGIDEKIESGVKLLMEKHPKLDRIDEAPVLNREASIENKIKELDSLAYGQVMSSIIRSLMNKEKFAVLFKLYRNGYVKYMYNLLTGEKMI